MQAKGIAARAGRWSTEHRKAAILGWLAFVVIAFVIGGSVGSKELADEDRYQGESGRAETAIVEAGMKPPAGESILIKSDALTADDRAFSAAIADVERRVARVPVIENVQTGTVSKDRHAALVTFDVKGDSELAPDHYDAITAPAKAAAAVHPQLRIQQFGDATANKELEDVFAGDLEKAGKLSVPATLLILLFAFGAIVAAGAPVLLALSAVAATMGLVALPSQLFPIDDATAAVILLIGMAVGVDYSLFYMRREREERTAGHDPKTAVQRAAATSGRAVLVSGLTVMTAMAGMFLSGDKTFIGIGLGALLVVGVAMIGSLTVLPAMMAWLGDRIEKGRIPYFGRRRSDVTQSRLWGAIVDRVLKRPVVSAVAATAFLVALAVPALGMKTVMPSPSDFPQDLPAVKAYAEMNKAFPGKNTAAKVVVEDGDLRSGDAAAAIAELKRRALATGEMYEPITTRLSNDGTVAEISIPLAGDGADERSKDALTALRDEILPTTVGRVATVNVTGMTAQSVDGDEQLARSMPLVFGFVLILAFGLLLVTFRSIVVPVKAIMLNLLSVGAAYGVLKVVFQDGLGEGLLGFESNGGITPWLPLFLFVVLFGLSMDYHVFILSRIREAVDRGMQTDEAVSHGIKTTAGTVTSAALVMVAVFSIFATLSMVDFKQMGVGLAVAVLIDATVIRAVLLPATMKLLGEHNWYLPKFLGWMPRVSHEPAVESAVKPARA